MNAGRCDACDFGYGTADPPDVPERLAPAIDSFRRELHTHDARVLRARPQPQTWSALEYACHVRDVLLVQKDRLYRALVEDTPGCTRMHREERVILARYSGSGWGRKAAHMTEGRDERPVSRAQRHLLLADLDGTLYQLFSVTFTRDGIFVNFPYRPDAPGAACRAPVEPTGAVAVNLDAVTSTTTHRVKYAHHVDGRAHFSQDQKIHTRIVNQARRLDEDIPHMFTMSLQGIGQFAPLAGVKTRYTPSRFTLDGYQDHPRLQITGRWFAQPSGLVDTMANPWPRRWTASSSPTSGDRGSRRVAARRRSAGHERVARGRPAGDRGFAPPVHGPVLPGLGHGTAGSLVMLTYPDIAATTGRPSLDYSPGTLVKP